MDLLLQVVGVLAAGLVVSALLRDGSRRPRLDRKAVAIAVAGIGMLLFAGHVIGHLRSFYDERKALAGVTRFEAETAPGADNGQNIAFLKWANQQMAPGDTFAVYPTDLRQRVDKFIPYQWSTFQLTPHRSVAPADADWLVFYGADPAAESYDRASFPQPTTFSPGYALARRIDAG
jgi:hypothetical protein